MYFIDVDLINGRAEDSSGATLSSLHFLKQKSITKLKAIPQKSSTLNSSKVLRQNVSLDYNSFQLKYWGLPKFHLEHKETFLKATKPVHTKMFLPGGKCRVTGLKRLQTSLKTTPWPRPAYMHEQTLPARTTKKLKGVTL